MSLLFRTLLLVERILLALAGQSGVVCLAGEQRARCV
jgi:hypothetical protein